MDAHSGFFVQMTINSQMDMARRASNSESVAEVR